MKKKESIERQRFETELKAKEEELNKQLKDKEQESQ